MPIRINILKALSVNRLWNVDFMKKSYSDSLRPHPWKLWWGRKSWELTAIGSEAKKQRDFWAKSPYISLRIFVVSPYFCADIGRPTGQRENAGVFFKRVKNRSISCVFCKKQTTFCKKRPRNCKNLSKKGLIWRTLAFAPLFLGQKRWSRIFANRKIAHKSL